MKVLSLLLSLTLFITTTIASPLDIRNGADALEASWTVDFSQPHGQYDSLTGEFSIHNMPEDVFKIYPKLPSRAMSNEFLDAPGSYVINNPDDYRILYLGNAGFAGSFVDTEWSQPQTGFSITSLFGWPEVWELGAILQPGQESLFTPLEWIHTNGGGDNTWPIFAVVPEPSSLLIVFVGFLCIIFRRKACLQN